MEQPQYAWATGGDPALIIKRDIAIGGFGNVLEVGPMMLTLIKSLRTIQQER